MRHPPQSPNCSPCHHIYTLSTYSPCGCKGDPPKMQIQSHPTLIKTFQRVPINFRITFQFHMRKVLEISRLPPPRIPAPSIMPNCGCSGRTKCPKRLAGLPSYAHVISNPRMHAFLCWPGNFTPSHPVKRSLTLLFMWSLLQKPCLIGIVYHHVL